MPGRVRMNAKRSARIPVWMIAALLFFGMVAKIVKFQIAERALSLRLLWGIMSENAIFANCCQSYNIEVPVRFTCWALFFLCSALKG